MQDDPAGVGMITLELGIVIGVFGIWITGCSLVVVLLPHVPSAALEAVFPDSERPATEPRHRLHR